jgi:DNA primase
MKLDVDALLAGIDLLAIAGKDTPLERVASTNGGEWAGPCPFCGGDDRFRLWPQHPGGRGRWWCRRCDRGGDAIAYLQERDGVSFGQAVEALGGDVDQAPSSTARVRRPAAWAVPDVPDVEPPADQWQARGRAFCRYARDQLWSAAGEGARSYLSEVRGLREDTVHRFGLGYNPHCLYDRPVSRWGLQGGQAVYLSRGIVIPCEVDGALWYVQVRRPLPGGPLLAYLGGDLPAWRPGTKYMAVKGSAGKALFGADNLQGRDVLLFCEGEFDAMLAWQELRDLVDVVTLGGATKGNRGLPGRWHLRLLHYRAILAAYDADGAGRSGAAILAQHSRRVVRVTVSSGGDLTGFYHGGGDLRAWLTTQKDTKTY